MPVTRNFRRAVEAVVHPNYAASSHLHGDYAASSHAHADYAASSHLHAAVYSSLGHLHTATYAPAVHASAHFVPLAVPLTSASLDGNDALGVGTTSLDTSALFGAPDGIKGAQVLVAATWAAASNDSYMAVRPKGGGVNYLVMRAQTTYGQNAHGYVSCDAAGDIDIIVAGATASNVVVRLLGYWIST